MLQKILIGGLALAIVGVIGFGVYDASRVPDATVEAADVAVVVTAVPPTPTAESPAVTEDVMPTVETEATAEAIAAAPVQPQPMSSGIMGTPWQATGTISTLEDFALTLTTDDGTFYVELGPPTYWQAQAVTLAEGDTIAVDGFYNGEMVHPATITTNDGSQLVLRTESGQPAWAGGTGQGGGMAGMQVAPEDWLTLTGTIGGVNNGQVALNVDDGAALLLQMGRPDFWQSQGVTLSAGDPVEVLGFWSGSQFMVGEVRKTETGETIMLRDPNGRQLWAGPGRNGGGQGQGQGQGNQGSGNRGNGNEQGQGNGNRGNGNRQGQGGYQATTTP